MNLSQKELEALEDLLGSEQLLVKKYEMFASSAQDETLQGQFHQIAEAHQGHYERLRQKLAQ